MALTRMGLDGLGHVSVALDGLGYVSVALTRTGLDMLVWL